MMSHEAKSGFSTPSAFSSDPNGYGDDYDTVNGAADHAEDAANREPAAPFVKQVQVSILDYAGEPAFGLTADQARGVLARVWNPSDLGAIEKASFDGDWLVDFRADSQTWAGMLAVGGYSGPAQYRGVRYEIELELNAG